MGNMYCERLRKNIVFQSGDSINIKYDMESDEYKELKEKYGLEQMKTPSDFETCRKVLDWVNKNILHVGNYDGSDKQDALTLLERAYKTDDGINCLSMSIVLCECLLALGIRARVVYMMPEAVEDGDNHVVVEAHVTDWKKWIMLDPTYGSYCVDNRGVVLNLYEIRNAIINGDNYNFCENLNYNGETGLDIEDIKNYYAKNVFFFRCKGEQGYGAHREHGICWKSHQPAFLFTTE